jgi:hypothetical protein
MLNFKCANEYLAGYVESLQAKAKTFSKPDKSHLCELVFMVNIAR